MRLQLQYFVLCLVVVTSWTQHYYFDLGWCVWFLPSWTWRRTAFYLGRRSSSILRWGGSSWLLFLAAHLNHCWFLKWTRAVTIAHIRGGCHNLRRCGRWANTLLAFLALLALEYLLVHTVNFLCFFLEGLYGCFEGNRSIVLMRFLTSHNSMRSTSLNSYFFVLYQDDLWSVFHQLLP